MQLAIPEHFPYAENSIIRKYKISYSKSDYFSL